MAVIWYKLVKSGQKTLDQVPEIWHDEVERMLEEDENQNQSQPESQEV